MKTEGDLMSDAYRQVGVDIDVANAAKRAMAEFIDRPDPRVLSKTGQFAALFHFDKTAYRDPVLVFKTEEPGSKQVLALEHGRIDSIARDMINHLVNDCIVMGATPLMVQDAIICGRIDNIVVTRMVQAIAEACRENECVLTGGETSEQPGVLRPGLYVMTSSIVGVVERDGIVDGRSIEEADVVIGLESSGPHTNGYTLIRDLVTRIPEILSRKIGTGTFLDAVLTPHRSYHHPLKRLLKDRMVKGMAHITGGGILENLNRVLPVDRDATIDLGAYRIPPVFRVLRDEAHLSDEEMLKVYNLGVGFVIVVSPPRVSEAINHLLGHGVPAYVIGTISKGSGAVIPMNRLQWQPSV